NESPSSSRPATMASEQASSVNADPSPPGRPWGRFILLLTLVALAAGVNLLVWKEHRPLPKGADLEAPAELSFNGSTDDLKETIFLPTLERPIPKGKSVIWCATMPMGWQELEKTVGKGPLDIEGMEEV